MSNYSKFNMVYRLQKWMDSVAGQTFLNYAYSWGASIVILGTLFKLTHLPLANLMLFLGMGTEVFVFFISAFDRPFDKTADGLELLTDEQLKAQKEAEENGTAVGGPQIIVAGGGVAGSEGVTVEGTQGGVIGGGIIGGGVIGGGVVETPAWVEQQKEMGSELEEAQSNYVEELKSLTEVLAKVSEQSERLTTDSIEMENLNRTLTGICKIYEMQLKGVSAQIGTIDQINEQTRKMAQLIEQLNTIYSRMIEAMTTNMHVAAPGIDLEK